MTNALLYFWTFLFGLIFGSFSNVVVLRDGERKSILSDRSHCPNCNHTLAWYDLFPVLSYLFLWGACRYCKKGISIQYPLVELLAGLLFLFSAWYGFVVHGSILLAASLAVALLLFLIISVIDIRTMYVPLEYCVAAGLIGGLGAIYSNYATWQQLGLGLLVGAGSITAIIYGWKFFTKQDGMGSGDIWVAGSIGAIVGYPNILVALMSAVMIGAVVGVAAIGLSKKGLSSAIPFGPFLFAGPLISLVWGQQLINWYILRI